MREVVLAYDARCGPCSRFRSIAEFLDARHLIGFESIESVSSRGLLDVLPLNLRHRSFHLVYPSGEVLSGARAVPGLVGMFLPRLLHAGPLVASPAARAVLSFAYSTLARLHGSGSCFQGPPERAEGPLQNPARAL
jgi:predicted DCC family thiol-disulfide oxidoreductase YuxK